MPGVIFLAYKYADDPARALGANARLSGDSCHRGSLLGALVGLASGEGNFLPERLERELHLADALATDVAAFASVCAPPGESREPAGPSLPLAEFLHQVKHVAADAKTAAPCVSG